MRSIRALTVLYLYLRLQTTAPTCILKVMKTMKLSKYHQLASESTSTKIQNDLTVILEKY